MIADVAFIFHWPLSELEALDLDELIAWHGRANDRMKAMLKMKADIMAAAR
ncbi:MULTISPECIES: GpE family phage tail protein [unclassified Sphingopyxis]|uniref:GpE family phage tail protein n=1 Tax=unclassified Sphingopyxis TaxID=2614943 RepID=UPI002278C738|nr:GpE family phage tail protein [Sphingopyxis sp. NFH-91]